MGLSMEDQQSCPAFVDTEFLQTSLRHGLEDPSLKIQSIQIRPANKLGDCYVSQMFRVTASYITDTKKSSTCSVVIKCLPQGDNMQDMVQAWNVFEKEGKAFKKLLPRLSQELQNAFSQKVPTFGAKCFRYGKIPSDFLVLEDLAPLGFRMAERRKGLDLSHCLIALKTLARFHASSVAVYRKDPSVYDGITDGMFSIKIKDFINTFVAGSFKGLSMAVKSWGNEYEYFSPRLANMAKTVHEALRELTVPKEGEIKVCTHGDMWVNNILFKYEDGNVCDIKLVDFQMSALASPAIDLQYFIHTSPSEEVRIKHHDTLLDTYISELNNTLTALNCPRVEEERVKQEYGKYKLYGLFAAVSILPIVLRGEQDDFDVNEAVGSDAGGGFNFLYSNECYVDAMKRMLPEFREAGVI